MIEQALIFVLGLITAAIIWLVMLPAFWRRAVRITRAQIEQSLPLSPNEIAAERDRLRVEQALRIARMEQAQARMQGDLVAAKTETGERLKTESGFLDRIAEGKLRGDVLETERDALLVRIAGLEAELDAMTEARDLGLASISGLEMQRDALTVRLNAAIDLAEQRRIALDEALVLGERAQQALEQETARNSQLRGELQARQIALRDLERHAEAVENDMAVERIRRGEAVLESAAPKAVAKAL